MYHYYVRYSAYDCYSKIEEGQSEIILTKKITSYRDILLIQKNIKKRNPDVCRVIIDFYAFLRKE